MHTQLGTHLIKIANAEVDIELFPQDLLEQVAWGMWCLLTVADQPSAHWLPQLVDMPMPLIIQSGFSLQLHAPLPSIGRCTADRQTHAGNRFAASTVPGS